MKKFLYMSLVLISLLSCSIIDSNNDEDEAVRTLPHAFSLETVTLQHLRNETTPPDSMNIDVYVTRVSVCPPDHYCFVPDGIAVAEYLNLESAEEQFYFSVQEPEQFEEGRFYLLSIGVRSNESGSRTFFDLLGYSRMEPNDN